MGMRNVLNSRFGLFLLALALIAPLSACPGGGGDDDDSGGGSAKGASSTRAEPSVAFVTPSVASVSGGETVTLTGENFESIKELRVLFGSIQSPAIKLINDTELSAVVPEGLQPGKIDITVMSGSKKRFRLKDAMTIDGWEPMAVSVVSPVGGPVEGGNTVSISGQNLYGPIEVTFGSTVISSKQINQVNSMLLTFTAPEGSGPGEVPITLIRSGGESTADAGFYEYGADPLSIERFSPRTVSSEGGELVNLYGLNFTPSTQVFVGGKPASHVEFVNETHLRMTMPIIEAGQHAITLEDPERDDYLAIEKITVTLPTMGQGESPYVAGAVSVDPHSVLVSFSEPMADSVENTGNYQIVAENNTSLIITAIYRQTNKDVLIETLAQSGVSYTVSVAGVTDMEGNPLRPEERGSRFDRATFTGKSESSSGGITDTDEDGLPDAEEQLGRVITITRSNGDKEKRVATSDPYEADSDGDGFNDQEEATIGIDPRSVDTDQDGINDFHEFNVIASDPTAQDSDGDGINDASEVFYGTSLILADSDGDQLSDYQELFDLSLNPLVANLPSFDHAISGVNLGLDIRYTYENAEGETVETVETIEESSSAENTSYSNVSTITYASNEGFFTVGGFVCGFSGCETGAGPTAGFRITAEGGATFRGGSDTTTGSGSDSSTINAYNQSLVRLSNTERSSVTTREVLGARATVAVNLRLKGETAMTLRNIEISLFQISPTVDNPGRLVPVGVLTPASGDLEVNLGPLNRERQGLIFTSNEIFPGEVERLMRAPNLLVAKISNYNSSDEYGRQFSYTEQEVFNRTAGFTIDYANGVVEQGLIAVVPTFNAETGKTEGKSITAALGAMDLVEYYPDKPLAELEAEGVDVDGTFGTQDGPDGNRIVTRVRNRQVDLDKPDRSFWLLVSTTGATPDSFEETQIDARQQYLFILTRDIDGDGLSEYEEKLIGTKDTDDDTDEDGLTDYLEVRGFPFAENPGPQWRVAYYNKPIDKGGLRLDYYEVFSDPTTADTDKDSLTDKQEYDMRQGAPEDGIWKADPGSVDTDIDGALDQGEVDGVTITLSYTPNDSSYSCPAHDDKDGSGTINEGDECTIKSAINIQDSDADSYSDGFEKLQGLNAAYDDRHHFNDADQDGLRDADDENDESGDADADGLPDMLEDYLGTGQLNPDTDGDTLSDGKEWLENVSTVNGNTPNSAELSALRSSCENARNCIWPSGAEALGTDPRDEDSDGDGLSDKQELDGWEVQLDAFDANGQVIEYHVDSDPLDTDTDDDGLNDKTESQDPKTDPRNPDTDNDGTSDSEDNVNGRSPLKADMLIQVGLISIKVYNNGEVKNAEGDVQPAFWSVLEPTLYTAEGHYSKIIQCENRDAWETGYLCAIQGTSDFAASAALARAIRYTPDATRVGRRASGQFAYSSFHPANDSSYPEFHGEFTAHSAYTNGACLVRSPVLYHPTVDENFSYRSIPTSTRASKTYNDEIMLNHANIFLSGDEYRFNPFQPSDVSPYDGWLKSKPVAIGFRDESHIAFTAIEFGEYAESSDCYNFEHELVVSYGGPDDSDAVFTGQDIVESSRKRIVLRRGAVTVNADTQNIDPNPDIEFVFEVRRVE